MGISVIVSETPPAGDQADAVITGTFAATGVSPSWQAMGAFNIVFGGPSGPNGTWAGSVQLEWSFDGGANWYVCGVGGGGQQAVYATPNQDVSLTVSQPERGVLFRLHCTSLTGGTVNYRFSTTGSQATSFGIV